MQLGLLAHQTAIWISRLSEEDSSSLMTLSFTNSLRCSTWLDKGEREWVDMFSLPMLKCPLSSNFGRWSQFRAVYCLPWLSDLLSELQSPVLLAFLPEDQGSSHNRWFWDPIPIIYLFMNLSILPCYWFRFSGERWRAHILNGEFLSWLLCVKI